MPPTTEHPTAGPSPVASLRLGFDLASVEDVRESLAGPARDRYLERVFTRAERRTPDPASLAECFAAKEATIKLLRPHAGDPVAWRDMDVRRRGGGAISVVLSGSALAIARRERIGPVTGRLASAGADLVAAVLVAEGA